MVIKDKMYLIDLEIKDIQCTQNWNLQRRECKTEQVFWNDQQINFPEIKKICIYTFKRHILY